MNEVIHVLEIQLKYQIKGQAKGGFTMKYDDSRVLHPL